MNAATEEVVRAQTAGCADAALYVHVPFCESKCSYCDFYSVPHDGSGRAKYVAALAIEGARRAPPAYRPATIFVGGGTPTALDDRDFAAMLETVRELGHPTKDTEWTIECNPGSLTPWKARAMQEAGVSRVSIGVQSFDDKILRSVGRVHDGATARRAVAIARDAGLPQISIDLLFAIPGQGMDTFVRDLDDAVALGTDHVSAYALIYEEGTTLERKRDEGLVEPESESVELAMLRLAKERLGAAGFRRYEISNFGRSGRECRHNLNYWRNGEYLGIGASAASYLVGERSTNVASWRVYEDRVHRGEDALASAERLPPHRAAGEEIMLRLRITEGFSMRALTVRWGTDARTRYGAIARRHVAAGLLAVSEDGDQIALTERGLEVADGIMADFVAAP